LEPTPTGVAAKAAARPSISGDLNMPGTTRGIIPARKYLLPLLAMVIAGLPLTARADDGMVDVRPLPRLDGAVEDTARTQPSSLQYRVPTVVAVTSDATAKLLSTNGWERYLRPLDEKSAALTFKKAQQGLYVSFTQGLGRPDQSVVYYSAERITANVPFPPNATDIVFDEHRPYLGCIAPAPLDATLDFSARSWRRSAGSRSAPLMRRRAGRTPK